MELSIILPTHNERENASLLIYALSKILEQVEHEVILVDDGSTDGTAKACRDISKICGSSLTVVERPEKLGLGNAYKRGLEEASGKYILLMDADLSHDPRDIPRLLKKLKETHASICIGSRYLKEGGVCNWSIFRRLTSRGANLLARIFTGLPCADMTNSYRIYKKDVLKCGIRSVGASGFAYQMEILYRCNATIAEIPVVFYERLSGVSKLSYKEYLHFLIRGTVILLDRFDLFIKKVLYIRKQ
ncbi:dolichol-phosphate mannosyltransferase [Nematocida sp. LUAm3]|nr:dolichol-phosphate mannosyltransferase [Nematocida sp. LUAm3]KAI5175330.1 dolichol-phosphate mannosyltransferase [Nematocida sp. LUAm2]KAI5177713.1 dolichol-phosphate mannosyltransferase [Nematocida sp. LUAm1]